MRSQVEDKSIRVGRYCIEGIPVAQTRTRFGNTREWSVNQSHKVLNGITLQSQHEEQPFFEGPISVNLAFYLPIIPASKLNLNTKPHSHYPEIDNLIKYIVNVASGILYKDDKIIATIVARKYYSTNPRTEIIISQIEDDTW